MRSLILFAALFTSTMFAHAEQRTVQSANDFDTTVQKLRDAIEASPASIVSEMNHAANATNAGLELRPTTLILFGNPAAGDGHHRAGRVGRRAEALPRDGS